MSLADLLRQRARYVAREVFDLLEGALERRLRRSRVSERLGSARPSEAGRWFTPEERELIEELTSVILPSDQIGPGAREAGVVDRLERRLAESPERRLLYERGLWGLDRLARREMGRAFTQWNPREREEFLKTLDRIAGGAGEASSAISRATDRARRLYFRWRLPAVHFLPELVDDTLQAFYTSPVAWNWLGYDGPPMPLGYLDLERRRA